MHKFLQSIRTWKPFFPVSWRILQNLANLAKNICQDLGTKFQKSRNFQKTKTPSTGKLLEAYYEGKAKSIATVSLGIAVFQNSFPVPPTNMFGNQSISSNSRGWNFTDPLLRVFYNILKLESAANRFIRYLPRKVWKVHIYWFEIYFQLLKFFSQNSVQLLEQLSMVFMIKLLGTCTAKKCSVPKTLETLCWKKSVKISQFLSNFLKKKKIQYLSVQSKFTLLFFRLKVLKRKFAIYSDEFFLLFYNLPMSGTVCSKLLSAFKKYNIEASPLLSEPNVVNSNPSISQFFS